MLAMSIHLKRRKMDKVILAIMYYFVSHILASCAPSSAIYGWRSRTIPWSQLPSKTELILFIMCTFIMHILKS